jgi:hypothetical protein
MTFVFTKPSAINRPEMANVHRLYRDNVTSHGRYESVDATEAPKPNRTRSEGIAQQSSVPRDVKSEK